MQIAKVANVNDLFTENLKKLLPVAAKNKAADTPKEEQLKDDRKEKKQEAVVDGISEVQLKEVHKDKDDVPLYERMLEEHRKAEMQGNAKIEGIVERRLNEASKEPYPHRNDSATRTGQKRPINALPEEMGEASDEGKRKRRDAAVNALKVAKRPVDKDVGSQLTNEKTVIKNRFNLHEARAAQKKPFNLHEQRMASYGDCIEYKKNPTSQRFASVKAIDDQLSGIMEKAQKEGRLLNKDEAEKVLALKKNKNTLLKIA